MEKKTEGYYGGKIHNILNNTLHRKLTLKEYSSVVENIQNLLVTCRQNEKDILVEIMEKHPLNKI